MATTVESSGTTSGRTWWIADLSVLVLVIIALVGGIILRQSNLNATQSASFQGLTFDVPKGALATPSPAGYAATTGSGLTVRVEKLPVPPIGTDDSGALISARALQQGKDRQLFQITSTDEVQVGGKNAGLAQYQYVESNTNKLFVSGLQVINGSELLIPAEESFYAVSLEGPSDMRAEMDALWPRIQSSARIGA